MNVTCLLCKTIFAAPAASQHRAVLLSCPVCGFLGHWHNGIFAVPTHSEEAGLERLSGQLLSNTTAPKTAAADDPTVMDEKERNLPLPYKRRLFIKIESGPRAGELLELTMGRIVIGRAGADIALDDAKLSRKHAVIEALSRENIFLRDLASTNGTFLNGVEITSKKLNNGDLIRVGVSELRFYWEDVAR